ncbi:ankyrin repeat protein [Paecilomyces variotii No. 5]|uniref:Ankyrin repeat protein n=1 Tax=Byssochlamys spectabilis (strain No. 5 / NBRC 109023) TaxID=1356009 RepID=V5HYZ8_BYSSN|nr:ankyrin repeat protein [Paecilomyces variotii No. 5]
MAAAFGIATGALGISSLTLQLLETTRSAHRFWKSVLEFPSESEDIFTILVGIERLLTSIDTLSSDGIEDDEIYSFLEHCKRPLQKAVEIIEQIKGKKLTEKLWNFKNFRKTISYPERLSTVKESLRETTDYLSLALMALQLYVAVLGIILSLGCPAHRSSRITRQQSTILSDLKKDVSSISERQATIHSQIRGRIDISRDLGLSFSSLDPDASQALAQAVLSVAQELVKSPPSTAIRAQSQDVHREGLSRFISHTNNETNHDMPLPAQESDFQMHMVNVSCDNNRHVHDREDNKSLEMKSRQAILFGGALSVSFYRRRHTNPANERNHGYTEVKIKISPSILTSTGFFASFRSYPTGGYNLQQSLSVIITLPWDCPLFSEVLFEFLKGDVEAVQKIFGKQPAIVNSVDEDGLSLLSRACMTGRAEIVRLLLDFGANSHLLGNDGSTPLHNTATWTWSKTRWDIVRLLISRSQLDPWAPDSLGRNFWHRFCETNQRGRTSSWKSVAESFIPILNEQDGLGRTSLYILSSNPKADLDIFEWRLKTNVNILLNPASGEFATDLPGLTCLHAAIASLQPRRYRGKLNRNGFKTGVSVMWSTSKVYREKDRRCQKRKIELLISNGADLFAVSKRYGTPTDIARLTGNFHFWMETLRDYGIQPRQVLKADKRVLRDSYYRDNTLHSAFEKKKYLRYCIAQMQHIFNLLKDFYNRCNCSVNRSAVRAALPRTVLSMWIGSYEESLLMLRRVLDSAIREGIISSDQNNVEVNFINSRTGPYSSAFANGSLFIGEYTLQYIFPIDKQALYHYLETFAVIVSGDSVVDGSIVEDWGMYSRFLETMKHVAVAYFEYESQFRLGKRDYDLTDEVVKSSETIPKVPGAWPEA